MRRLLFDLIFHAFGASAEQLEHYHHNISPTGRGKRVPMTEFTPADEARWKRWLGFLAQIGPRGD